MTSLAAGLASSSSTISDVEPGLLGFLVVAALGIALVFLLRSMNKQFKKIGPRPEDPDMAAADEASEAETDAAAINAAAGIGPTQAERDRAAIIAEAAAAEPDTGAGFVPDTGGRP